MSKSVAVFCSYSHQDEALRKELGNHLSVWERQGLISVWCDLKIEAGRERDKETAKQLNQADIILPLLSPDYLASDTYHDREIQQRTLAQHQAGEARVIPILLRPVMLEGTPFRILQALPRNGVPITSCPNRDKAFVEVAEEIIAVAKQIQEARKPYAPNPFGDRGCITDPARFFDRDELLRQIFEELNKGVNLSLVGESQIGKSSILRHICHLGPKQWSSRSGPTPKFAYLNLELVDHEEDFYEALGDVLEITPSCRGFRLARAMQGHRYVLCLDEMEKMTWDGFTKKLRSQLRGLADGGDAPLKLVVASRSSVEDLFPDSPELGSPMAGIFSQLVVPYFSEKIAHMFLRQRLKSTDVSFSEHDIVQMWQQTKGHPAKLQQMAAVLYSRLIQGYEVMN